MNKFSFCYPYLLSLSLVACSNGGGGNNDVNAIDKAINVDAVSIQGDFSLNNSAFPVSQYENG